MSRMDHGSTFKILVLGESGVGKTSLIRRFAEGHYQDSYISTIGIDSKTKSVTLDDEVVRLQIWDTAGQERFRTITSAYYRGAMGIILVYDITTESSFSSISNWLDTIHQNASATVCKVLIGNKCDCPGGMRSITEKKGRDRANGCGLKFFETSAKTGDNVALVFETLAEMIKNEKTRIREEREQSLIIENDTNNSSGCC